jgi:AcrR family transcriptional regulator
MARSYVKTRRADNQAETRERIVAAAVALHGEIGPTATTISMIAERAGVQRHTVYAHFADELSLLMACSGLHLEQHPLPAPEAWSQLPTPQARLTAALTALYAWFAQNEAMAANVLRDAEQNAALRQVTELRFGGAFGRIFASLAPGLGPAGKAALTLALSFHTWRTLTRDARLGEKKAVAQMVRAILTADA